MQNIKNYSADENAKRWIIEIGRRIYNKNYVVSNDGNISVMTEDGAIWTTPTGVSKGFMTEEMLVKTDLEGNILEGTWTPSSEVKMHYRVYRENPVVRSVIHAHPPVATAFAASGRALDKPYLTEGILQLGVVPLVPYAVPTTQEVPDAIAPFCNAYNGLLLANHGALTWGRDILEAWRRMESLEYYANAIRLTEQIAHKTCGLTECQINQLVELRTKLGILTGGKPEGVDS